MKAQFKLVPAPTFKVNVTIPVPGAEDGQLTITFKHRPLKELTSLEQEEGKTIPSLLEDLIEGWALPEPFNAENLDILLNNYPQAGSSIMKAYYSELVGAREKN
ncbi:hypothetical protein A8A01_03095 [Ewingella americana]|nr:hypothetical protein A8A01_03095 [Ewingella americana]